MTSGLNVKGSVGSTLSLQNIQTQFSTVNNVSELQVTATASLWQQDSVEVLFVFYYKESILDFYCEFEVDLDGFPDSIVPSSASSWFGGLSLTGTNKISIATATFTDNKGVNYERGMYTLKSQHIVIYFQMKIEFSILIIIIRFVDFGQCLDESTFPYSR